MIFWDTSALVRCYARLEPGHARAVNLLASRERQAGSVLLLPEATGALTRFAGSDRALRDKIMESMRTHLSKFDLLPADIAQAELAAHFTGEHGLKGADALHVASACILVRELRRGLRFVTSDVEQAAAARAEKLKVILVA